MLKTDHRMFLTQFHESYIRISSSLWFWRLCRTLSSIQKPSRTNFQCDYEIYVNLNEKCWSATFQVILVRLCSSFALGRVSEVEEQQDTHTATHWNTCTQSDALLWFDTQWSLFSCFCRNEVWFTFQCLEMSQHLSKLCRLFFMCVSTSLLLT